MTTLHPTAEEMIAALLEAAEAERWNHWEHEVRAHLGDWAKTGCMRRPLRSDEFARLPVAVAQYQFVELCVYGYGSRAVWGFYARKLPFSKQILKNVLVVYDPCAAEILHCMYPLRGKHYCERWGKQRRLFVRVRW